jgi:predicted metal-binding membrane protein
MADLTGKPEPVGRDAGRVIWLLASACWLLLVILVKLAPDLIDRHSQIVQFQRYSNSFLVAGFAFAGLVSVIAMVLPTIVPAVRLFTAMTPRVARPASVWVLFTAGYLDVWVVVTGVALAGDAALHELIETTAWLWSRNALALAVALELAGVAQFVPLTRRCLNVCHDPRAFLSRHYRPGPDGACKLGVRLGLWSLGYCWPFLAVIFAFGVGNFWLMIPLAAVITTENTARRGPQLVAPLGIALLAAGTWLGLSEWLSPGLGDVSAPGQAHQH